VDKRRTKTFRESWENSGKKPSHPPKYACSYTYVMTCALNNNFHKILYVHLSLGSEVIVTTSSVIPNVAQIKLQDIRPYLQSRKDKMKIKTNKT